MSDVLANGLNVNVNIQPSVEPDAGHIEVNILPTQSGEKGDDGATFRPQVDENGILSWTNDKNLENPEPVNIKGPEGDPGENGISPTAKVKETAEGAELTVTDADGETKAVIKHGKDGYTPQKGIDYFDGKPGENGYTPVKGVDYFDGKNGEPGEPGFSPTAKVTQTADGARIDITDKSGTTSAIVKNGKDGADAEGGGLPTGGEPHQMLVTDADGNTVWEDRTHYSYEEHSELLPETTYTEEALSAGAADIQIPITLEADKSYTVRYNGTDYQCTPLIMPAKPILEQFGVTVDDSVMGGILGNVGMLEPSLATNEPFVLMAFQGTNIGAEYGFESYGMIMPLDGSNEVTLSISGMVKKYKKIAKEYLPNSKEIIFTKGEDGQYTCNIPHAELWEMDADAIAKNARIINGEEEYSVRGASKKTESLYGNVIQVYADLNVGSYDVPALYHRTLMLTYCVPAPVGKQMIFAEEVSSLNNSRPNSTSLCVPVLSTNGYWGNGIADFMEYDGERGVYTLKTMSPTVKGGAKVGKGLSMDGDTLNVDEGEYELIDTVTVNEDVTRLELSQESDGKQYNFTSVMVRMRSVISTEDATGKIAFICRNTMIGGAYIRKIVALESEQIVCAICELHHGRWLTFALGSVEYDNFGRNSTVENYPMSNGLYGKERSSVDKIVINANGSANNIKAGTVVEIWGVRA